AEHPDRDRQRRSLPGLRREGSRRRRRVHGRYAREGEALTLPLQRDVPLGPLTTMGVGGTARLYVEADSEHGVVEALSYAKTHALAVSVLGGGSNLLVADRGVEGVVVRVRIPGKRIREEDGTILLEGGAGEAWDDIVALAVGEGLAGLECLSGI